MGGGLILELFVRAKVIRRHQVAAFPHRPVVVGRLRLLGIPKPGRDVSAHHVNRKLSAREGLAHFLIARFPVELPVGAVLRERAKSAGHGIWDAHGSLRQRGRRRRAQENIPPDRVQVSQRFGCVHLDGDFIERGQTAFEGALGNQLQVPRFVRARAEGPQATDATEEEIQPVNRRRGEFSVLVGSLFHRQLCRVDQKRIGCDGDRPWLDVGHFRFAAHLFRKREEILLGRPGKNHPAMIQDPYLAVTTALLGIQGNFRTLRRLHRETNVLRVWRRRSNIDVGDRGVALVFMKVKRDIRRVRFSSSGNSDNRQDYAQRQHAFLPRSELVTVTLAIVYIKRTWPCKWP